jgi:hypothetical protein
MGGLVTGTGTLHRVEVAWDDETMGLIPARHLIVTGHVDAEVGELLEVVLDLRGELRLMRAQISALRIEVAALRSGRRSAS